MASMRWCKHCKDWVLPNHYDEHMKQHNVGMNSDALDVKQYTGNKTAGENYAICILHQKKCPCPVEGCKYIPFGWIRKSIMMQYYKRGIWKWHDIHGNDIDVPIDQETRTVVLYGVTIHLRI